MSTIKLYAIAAMAENRVIGKDNALIWHLPQDLQHFKQVTMGCPMVMGRKSFESLPGILPGRPHVVMTRKPDALPSHDAVHPAPSLEGAIDTARGLAEQAGQDTVFIAGGGDVYAQSLPVVERLYLTIVHQDFDGDTHFPKLDWSAWEVTDSVEHEEDPNAGKPAFTLLTLDRV